MQFKNIELSDKAIFDDYYKKNKQVSSYTSFVTLYTWSRLTKAAFAMYEGELIIRFFSCRDDRSCFVIPQCEKESIKKVIDFLIKEEGKIRIYHITNEQYEIIKEVYGDTFTYERRRNDDNYIYESEQLISLAGKKLHSKRNFLNRFKKEYEYSYVKLDEELAKKCVKTAINWCERKTCETGDSMNMELSACETALLNMNKLGLIGGAIVIDGEIAAFSLGEILNDEVAIVHFEKGNTDYVGIYPAINNEFVKNELSDIKYINREEDMGVEGLRKAKLSYYPSFMLEFYVIDNG